MSQGLSPNTTFADRLAALVEQRRSQVCLGLDPDPAKLADAAGAQAEPGRAAADAVVRHCGELIAVAGPACVAVKPQLACFERLGPPGWEALHAVAGLGRDAGLVVIADGKRGDVPHTAAAYAQALFAGTPTPWGPVAGIGADAVTLNAFLGGDTLDPFVDAAAAARGGLFTVVRSSNPGAVDLLDLDAGGAPLYERVAALVEARAVRLAGESGLSGMGAVAGATEPRHLGRLRELMPTSVFLVPGVGAQGGRPEDLGPAFGSHPASVLVAASRSIAGADDPAAAAEDLRARIWGVAADVG